MRLTRTPLRLRFAAIIGVLILVASIAWIIVHFSTAGMNRTLAGDPQDLEPILRHHIGGVAHLWAKKRPDPDAPERWFIIEPDPHLASLLEAYYGSRVQILTDLSDGARLAMTASEAEFVCATVHRELESTAIVDLFVIRKKDSVGTKLFLEYANNGWRVAKTEPLPQPLFFSPHRASPLD